MYKLFFILGKNVDCSQKVQAITSHFSEHVWKEETEATRKYLQELQLEESYF